MLHTKLLRGIADSLDISTAVYDNTVLDMVSRDTLAQAILFNDDGLEFYFLGEASDRVHKYTLASAYKVTSSATYIGSSALVSTEDGTMAGMTFGASGTKLFMVGSTGDRVYRYSLTTAYDPTTLSYDGGAYDLDVSTQTLLPVGIEISTDGTKIFISDSVADRVYSYTLTTANNPSSGSYDGASNDLDPSVLIGPPETGPKSIRFMPGGKVAVVVLVSYGVYQIALSTAWDLSTASYNGIFYNSSPPISTYYDVALDPGGLSMVILDQADARAEPFTLSLR